MALLSFDLGTGESRPSMSMGEARPNLPPDYVCVPQKLHRIASNWSLCDLDKVIWALERYLVPACN